METHAKYEYVFIYFLIFLIYSIMAIITNKFSLSLSLSLQQNVKNPRLKSKLQYQEANFNDAARNAAKAEEYLLMESKGFLEAEGDLEKTYKISQAEIKKNVDIQTARKAFDLKLPDLGPYNIDYSRTGNHLLIGGSKGHIAAFDWKQGILSSEIQVGETVRAVKWLQSDNQFFAVAQKKYTFIYDSQGTEVHKLKKHIGAMALEYLPFHFLLASASDSGLLRYQDVSTGDLVAEIRTKLGSPSAMALNPYNAVVHLGHNNGAVTLWGPNTETPLAKVLANRGPIRAIAMDREGRYMACAGSNKQIKIWDIRNFKETVQSYGTHTPASSLQISDSGLLAVGFSNTVQVWKDVLTSSPEDLGKQTPYMEHVMPGCPINNIRFCPFEDILGVGHAKGISSLIVPGAGEANFDGLEVNPYMNASREGRRENEVREIMNKLQPTMIALDPNTIGAVTAHAESVRLRPAARAALAEKEAEEALAATKEGKGDFFNDMRPDLPESQSVINHRLQKRKKNIVDDRKIRLQNALEVERKMRQQRIRKARGEEEKEKLGAALGRFK